MAAGVLNDIFNGRSVPVAPPMGGLMKNEAEEHLPKGVSVEKLTEYNKNFEELKTALHKLDAVLASSNQEQASGEVARLLNQIASIDLPTEVKNKELGRHSTQTQSEVREALKSSGNAKETQAARAAHQTLQNIMIGERMMAAASFKNYQRAIDAFRNAPLTAESIAAFNRATTESIAQSNKEFDDEMAAVRKMDDPQKQKEELARMQKEREAQLEAIRKRMRERSERMKTLDPNSEEYRKLVIEQQNDGRWIDALQDQNAQIRAENKKVEENVFDSHHQGQSVGENQQTRHEVNSVRNSVGETTQVSENVSLEKTGDDKGIVTAMGGLNPQHNILNENNNPSAVAGDQKVTGGIETASISFDMNFAEFDNILGNDNNPPAVANTQNVAAPSIPSNQNNTETVSAPQTNGNASKTLALSGAKLVETSLDDEQLLFNIDNLLSSQRA